ncbi:MAG: histidine phosphatase family protein [Deltaproteobacteria bacterium]|nr:histidine phosphatase family protein [Deltaproteobacteria bacterium]
MKQLYLIRHAKSSWSRPDLDDFDRPLNKRGRKNAPFMAGRLSARGIFPQRIVASPAGRAKKTALFIAEGTGFDKNDIIYDMKLYAAEQSTYLDSIAYYLGEVDTLFMVGHNPTITELAEYLTGERFFNVPTCGVVGIGYKGKKGFVKAPGGGSLLIFDFPKKIVP